MRLGVYKHVNNTDVAMKVVKSLYIPAKGGWKVRVLWLNIVNPKNIFLIDLKHETHFISRDKASGWENYDVGTL